jgi:hypothetical protein
MNRFASIAAGAAVSLAAGGCLIVTGNTHHETGVRVSDSTLSQVEPGKTTEAWLLATLGEPTARTRIECDRKVEILRYEHSTHKSSGGAVFLIFAGGSDRSDRSVAYFEVTDGIVTRAWRETNPPERA